MTAPPLAGSFRGLAASDSSVSGVPWTFIVLAGLISAAVGILGPDRAIFLGVLVINLVFLVFFLRHVAFAAAAARWAPTDLYESPEVPSDDLPTVSVLVACHNEESVVPGLIRGLVALHYPRSRLEILIVNDGSSDRTGELLDQLTAGIRHMRVIHRPAGAGGGKSGALNAALAEAKGEIVVVFDADHIPRRNVIHRLVRHFRDPTVAAVQGRCIVRNSVQSTLARSIAIDYFSGYLVNEYGRQALFGLPAYGGANCAVRTALLRQFGGWNVNSVTEDTDITLRLVLAGYRVRYDITAVDTEEGATTLARFVRQRYRWARGHQQVWRDYRRGVWRCPHLTLGQKIETTLFLLVYHVPVFCTLTLVLTLLRLAGIGPHVSVVELLPLAALLFAGPFCELAVGLLVGRAPRRAAWSVAWMTPLFIVFMLVCTRAWIDGLLGRPYTWVKTKRSQWNALAGREEIADRGPLAEERP
ncbi:MAG: glycosyltransferase family 2 protein [Acidothermus cellulolyticus]|nr:glycosyltransferase family 2 protein [Acidothermus cellulolyticus]MCL6550087.1 glycosyltransferase family 2 protein [Acidothermus cellulolyticus]